MAAEEKPRWGRRIAYGVGVVVGAIVVLLLLFAILPPSTADLGATPSHPARTYGAAMARVRAVKALEGGVRPVCRSRLYTHGARTSHVMVLFHGLTNCPRQMLDLAQRLYADGANVLVLRAPGHGMPGDVGESGWVSATDFRDYAEGSVDIARGLGTHTTVVGLSLGGMLSAWSAEQHLGVSRAVILAPALRLGSVPAWVSDTFTNVFTRLPNINLPGDGESVAHGYPPGTATYPTAELFLLGRRVLHQANGPAPPTRHLDVLINDADGTVSNEAIEELVASWRQSGRTVTLVHLPACLGLPHDVIDVSQRGQNIALVYPVVIAMAEGTPIPRVTAARCVK